jgi:hypothetical protein
MEVTRRDLLQLVGGAAVVGATSRRALAAALTPERLLAFQALGNVTLLPHHRHPRDASPCLLPRA